MANYLFLYSGGSMPASDAERQANDKEWDAWFRKLGTAVVDGGNPIRADARSVTADQNVIPVTGGPAPSGYSIVKAGSMDEAVELAKDCPALKHGSEVMVYEVYNAMR